MNANLLAIDNMLAGTTGPASVVSKPDASRKGTQSSPIRDDKRPKVNAPERITTDNAPTDTQKEVTNKPRQEFSQALRKKAKPKGPRKAQHGTESKEPIKASKTAEQPNVVRSWLAQHLALAEHSKEGAATRVEAKAGHKPAQLSVNSRIEKSPPVTGQAAKSAEIKLLLTTDKGQLGLKTVLPETSKGQRGLKTVLPNISKSTSTAKTQPAIGKSTDKIPVSDETVVDTKALTDSGNAKELLPEVPADAGSKMTPTDKKPAADSSAVADAPKAPVSSTKDLMFETPVDGTGKTATAGGKPATVDAGLPVVQARPSQAQPQLVGVDPEKAVPAAETDTKAVGPQTLSDTLGPKGKESVHAKSNLPNAPTVQKLYAAEVQAPAGQAEGLGSSSSDNGPHSNLGQMFSHDNPQIPIAEQSPISAESAKTTNLPEQAWSGDVSANIGKQILESVHSSLSQQTGDKQITVHLHPPELGKVFIKFQEQDAQITGILEVSKTQTRLEIEQALPQITRNLADSGIQVKRLEVVLSEGEQSAQQTLKDPLLQDGSFQQHSSANSGPSGNDHETAGTNHGPASDSSYQNIAGLQEMLVTDNSINMLA
ncbi:MAG: flagellar hook-length control protein FliK [Planctomycetota bacterium]|jgi:flagellar hook-length control protein FliK